MIRSGSTVRTARFSNNERRSFRLPAVIAAATLLAISIPNVVGAQARRAAAPNATFRALVICNVAGPGVALDTPFKFSIGNKVVTVPAGPAPGGRCKLAASNLPGPSVNIKEVTAGYTVRSITTNGQIGKVDLRQRTATVSRPSTGPGSTQVTFTNTHLGQGQQVGYVEICKQLDALVPPFSQSFSFTVQTQHVTVLSGLCSAPIEVIAGPEVKVTETTATAMTNCDTVPSTALVSCDIASHTATVGVVGNGQIGSETILTVTNCVSDVGGGSQCAPGPNVCPKINDKLKALAPIAPGTASVAFHNQARIALQDGCVVYTSSQNLHLEFIRGGSEVGTSITIGPPLITAPPIVPTNFFDDIALTASGTLYAIDGTPAVLTFPAVPTRLYTINPDTAVATQIPFTGLPSGTFLNGLVVGPDGNLWASGATGGSGVLYKISSTGVATAVNTTIPFRSSGDLAFSPNGNLYMTTPQLVSGGEADSILELSPTDGTPIPPLPPTLASIAAPAVPVEQAFGLVSSYGTSFAVLSPLGGVVFYGRLMQIDPVTRVGTQIGSTDSSHIVGGMAAPPPVSPEVP